MMKFLSRRLLEPFSALTHLVGVIGGVAGLILLVSLTRHDPPRLFSMVVYGFSVIFLFGASTLLHGVKTHHANRMWLNRLDHVAIFLLIAGTYTPIVYNLFPSPWRGGILTAVWGSVMIGSGFKLFRERIHGHLNTFIYVVLGWGGAAPLALAGNWLDAVPRQGLLLLLVGGLIYTAGFVIYCRQKPDPWPDVFGHHEIWHLFVLGGSLAHYLFILWYVVPFPRS